MKNNDFRLERFVKVEGKTYSEKDVNAMTLTEVKDLYSRINESIIELTQKTNFILSVTKFGYEDRGYRKLLALKNCFEKHRIWVKRILDNKFGVAGSSFHLRNYLFHKVACEMLSDEKIKEIEDVTQERVDKALQEKVIV